VNAEQYATLLPEITAVNQPFWDGCAAGELRLQQCDQCRTHRFPDGPVCPRCLSGASRWQPVSGKGTLWSWLRMHQRYFPAFADEVPYLVAYIKLAEGPFMVSALVEEPERLAVDLPVQAVFVPSASGRVIAKFRVTA
jgi:uncharacterized protein